MSDDATRQVKPGSADPASSSGGAAEVSHASSSDGAASAAHASEAARAARDILAGGGEMGALVRDLDWSVTPLGPLESWPQSLRSAVSICLGSGFPIAVYWGPELALLYNDAWSPIPGSKHPWALGKPGREVWPEIWDTIGPLFQHVMTSGEATRSKDQLLAMRRHGYTEECYFDYTFSPIRGESGRVEGIFNAVLETTERIIGERRLRTVRELAGRLADARTPDEACRITVDTLRNDPGDVPFALVYLVDAEGREARLVGTAGLEPRAPGSAPCVTLDGAADDATSPSSKAWPLARVVQTGQAEEVEDLEARFGPLPGGLWPESPGSALVLPVIRAAGERPYGVLVVGVSPRRELDDEYRGFLDLVAGHLAQAITNAIAYEAERERAESLAALDRAKTQFFSNVSHEFRTPLTLMLGPTEDLLAAPADATIAEHRAQLETLHRNELRLLKLVNTLLEYSRIEAGRAQAAFEPVDLATYTCELASNFRSLVERAGLRLTVDCPSCGDDVTTYVDRAMWEQIVLNLLSNAYKHTFEGEIAVIMRRAGDEGLTLEVRDTGVGIPADQLPHVFERFHRVPNARSRTHEGTGIGLALVQELVKLHGGTITAESTEGQGTVFTVRLPFGSKHLPANQVRSRPTEDPARTPRTFNTLGAAPFVEEARQWTRGAVALELVSGSVWGGSASEGSTSDGTPQKLGRVLLADDNADMREYVARLLSEVGWEVEVVPDGDRALAAVQTRVPDVLVTDVMMPGLDGFQLLRALRAAPATATIPVILLSAQAEGTARRSALDAGADDYVLKPFSAQELIARVGAHARLARERARLLAVEKEARKGAEEANRAKSDFLAAMSHELRTPLNAIAGHAQLMEMGIHGNLTEAQRVALGRIQRSEQHLLSLINDVLNFAKLEAGRVEYDVEDVALAEVAAEVLSMVEPQLTAKGIATAMRVPESAVARGDREKVRQILLNLLSNAIKFTNTGGQITIDAPTRDRGLEAPGAPSIAGAAPLMVYLRVSDTGIGIARDKQEAIFDPFVQIHRALTHTSEGTGLGLAISRDLAHGMHGELRVRSEVGQGSAFTLALPRAG